ncbi:hypothetical protein KFK09_014776 [Dendrobium nobile]|uniref:Uncharacterized protein n=1 Tax=Dendrobium nobile TaxID=94219 RepID=A0A8T3B5E0_DENNO|nr:hypothetical protein KFK09_014776 [Dendrobium nobile]
MQCPQAVRRNVNEGFDTKFVGLGDKPVGTSIIAMIQANIAKENAEDDGTRNKLISMLFGGLKVWSGNPIMFSRYDTSISEIMPDRTTEEERHASNFFFALSACNTMVPLVVDIPDPAQKLIDYQGKSLNELTLVYAAVASSLLKEVGTNIENKIFDPGGLLFPSRQRVSTESSFLDARGV